MPIGYIYIAHSDSFSNLKIGVLRCKFNYTYAGKKLYRRYRTPYGSSVQFELYEVDKKLRKAELSIEQALNEYKIENEIYKKEAFSQAKKICGQLFANHRKWTKETPIEKDSFPCEICGAILSMVSEHQIGRHQQSARCQLAKYKAKAKKYKLLYLKYKYPNTFGN